LCIKPNETVDKKTMNVFSIRNMFAEVLEVSKAVKQASETCENCLGCGNEANPPVRILLNPKTIFWF